MQTTPRWQPTARHLRFHSALREVGCCVTGEMHNVQLHHVVGASARHNKVWIGQWWVLLLHKSLHDVDSNDPQNVTHFKKRFEQKYGCQKQLFKQQVLTLTGFAEMGLVKFDLSDLPPDDVMMAIEGYVK